MAKKRILLLVHKDLVPPDYRVRRQERLGAAWRTEYDVAQTLMSLDYSLKIVGLDHDLDPLLRGIKEFRPECVFNLLEEFRGEAIYESYVVALLETLGIAYTGCGPKGLMLARDKMLAKRILSNQGVQVPRGVLISREKSPRQMIGLDFPLIVKGNSEEASLGISASNVVRSVGKFAKTVARVQNRLNDDLLVEEYVEGREIYVSIIVRSGRIEILPLRELIFGRLPSSVARVASARIKWDAAYRRRWGIYTRKIRDSKSSSWYGDLRRYVEVAVRSLQITGYARLDFRLAAAGQLYFIEANPNPQIAQGEDFADSAMAAGYSYRELIRSLVEQS